MYDIIIYFKDLIKPVYKQKLNNEMLVYYLQAIQKINTFESVIIRRLDNAKQESKKTT